MKLISVICLLGLLAACASEPVAPAAPADASARKPLNGNMVRSAVAPTSDADKDLAAWARGQGFRLQKRDDKVMWCKSEAEIGSKLARNNCVSDATLAEMRSTYEANKQQLRDALTTCTGGGACGQK